MSRRTSHAATDHRRATRREKGALAALLGLSALLYLWGLGASGYANDFYAAAVQAGTKSWKAFFFGSLDSANSITVDKPPAALWPMELSGRIFGFSSWSMLVPQALMGVASVWLLYATVRRWFGPGAGLLAGALLAITPVAVLMFRFNNPDALMTLLIVAAAYCVTRALEHASTKWLLLAGAAMGFSFLAKGLQPFTVLPALAIAYVVAAPTSLRRRLLHLLGAGVAIVARPGWWVLAVDLTPAADRPYIGGSGNNTALGLAFGYNGLSRITGGAGRAAAVAQLQRLDRHRPAVQLAQRRSDLVAAAGRAHRDRRARRRRRPCRPHRPPPRRADHLGRLVARDRRRAEFRDRDHPHLLHDRARAGDRRARRDRAVVLWRRRAELGARVALAAGASSPGCGACRCCIAAAPGCPGSRSWSSSPACVGAFAVLVPPGTVRLPRRRRLAAGIVALSGGSAAYAVDTAATAAHRLDPVGRPGGQLVGIGGRRLRTPWRHDRGPGGTSGDGGFPGGTRGRHTAGRVHTAVRAATPPSGSTVRPAPDRAARAAGWASRRSRPRWSRC